MNKDHVAGCGAWPMCAGCPYPYGFILGVPPTGLTGGLAFSNFSRMWPGAGDTPPEPVMKRNARNKGPRKQREWWRR